jgi:Fe2+ transport system protein FeoA
LAASRASPQLILTFILNTSTLGAVTLDELKNNRPATVLAVDVRDAVILRLMEMGLVAGATVSVKKRAPFGGPLELQVGDYLLSIRSHEARAFSVEPEP